MLFNSIAFFIFLPTVFILYWFVFNKNLKLQNGFVLLASYFFYGWWDWRFLSLIIISSLTDYFIGVSLDKSESLKKRKQLKYLSIAVNIGILAIFKYYNFFANSFSEILQSVGLHVNTPTLNIVLPIGISFYTFQTIGYSLDVYKKKIKAEKNLLNFLVYVCFFPQLVAGPIERAKNLLPQIAKKRIFSYEAASDGLRLILLGLFKKVVIADNLSVAVEYIFNDYSNQNTITLVLGSFLFIIQIYCDFAGYSEIAVGTARLFGFKLMRNFDFPFYTHSIQEFWTRWHISLSNWFRDYLLFGFKSSFKSKNRFAFNFLLTLTLIGFWHGANGTFIMFGFLNGLYIIPNLLLRKKKNKFSISRNTLLPTPKELLHMTKVMGLISISAIFFRSPDLTNSFSYFKHIVLNYSFDPSIPEEVKSKVFLAFIVLIYEWFIRHRQHGLDIAHLKKPIRWSFYIIFIVLIINYGEFNLNQFIYFKF